MPSEMAMRVEEAHLTYVFNNIRPIELLDLTSSLLALGEEYQSFLRRRGEGLAKDNYRLYVREVRTGSIIIDLISFATEPQFLGTAMLPVLLQYATELGDWFDFFKGIKDAKDIKDLLLGKSKKDLQQLSVIIEPAAKDAGSQISITAAQGAVIIVNSTISSNEANAGQNVLRRHIEHIAPTVNGIHTDQVLYWYQVRDDRAAKPGDLAVIERLWRNPVKVRFTSDEIKREMIDNQDNPFKKFYLITHLAQPACLWYKP
jgi:hypothetical protein